jgi:hypothetical protein
LVPVSKPTTSAPADGVQWCMLAYVKDRTTGRYYLDGTRSSSDFSAAFNATFNTTDLCIGKDFWDNNFLFAGSIGLLAAFNRALSDVEISAIHDSYRGRFSPSYKIAAPSLSSTALTLLTSPTSSARGRSCLSSLILTNSPVTGKTTWSMSGAPDNYLIDPSTGEVSAAPGTILAPADLVAIATNPAGTSSSSVTVSGVPTFPAAPMGADFSAIAATKVSATAYGAGCGHGDHLASASSGSAYKAFTCATSSEAGWTPTGSYTITTGVYSGSVSTTSSTGTHTGEFLQLRLPHPVLLSGYAITVRDVGTSPQDFSLLGSNDGGATWSLLDSVTGNKKFVNMIAQTFGVTGNYGAHSTFRLVVSKANGAGTTVAVYDLRLLGRPVVTPVLAQPSYELGAYNMYPWSATNFPDTAAKWIWNTSDAATANNLPITVYGYFYNATGSSLVATLTASCDNQVTGSINGTQVLSSIEGNPPTSKSVTLVAGLNTLSFSLLNTDVIGYGGFIASMADTSGNVLWRTNKSLACTFLPSVSNVVGFYTSDSLAGSASLHDLSGLQNHAVISGSGVAKAAMDAGTRGYLYGGVNASIQFPYNVLPPTYTLFHVSKYNGAAKGRILTGGLGKADVVDWLSGFHNGNNGVAFHNGTNWVTPNPIVNLGHVGFVVSSDQKGLYRSNKVDRTANNLAFYGTPYMSVNAWGGEVSDWAVAMILVFDKELSASEIAFVEAWIDRAYPAPAPVAVATSSQLNVIKTVTNNSVQFNMYDYFSKALSDRYLFSATSPNGNVTFDVTSKTMTLTGADRTSSYDVVVTAACGDQKTTNTITVVENCGLLYRTFAGYANDVVTFVDTAVQLNSGLATDFSTIATATGGNILTSDNGFKAAEWYGQFYATSAGTWTFAIPASDDFTMVWLGDTAMTGYTLTNSLVRNGYSAATTGANSVPSATATLSKDTRYPIRVQWSNGGGPGGLQISVTPPGGVSTSDLSKWVLAPHGKNALGPALNYSMLNSLYTPATESYYIKTSASAATMQRYVFNTFWHRNDLGFVAPSNYQLLTAKTELALKDAVFDGLINRIHFLDGQTFKITMTSDYDAHGTLWIFHTEPVDTAAVSTQFTGGRTNFRQDAFGYLA